MAETATAVRARESEPDCGCDERQANPQALAEIDTLLRKLHKLAGEDGDYPKKHKSDNLRAAARRPWRDPEWRRRHLQKFADARAREKAAGTYKQKRSNAVYGADGTVFHTLRHMTRAQGKTFWKQAKFEATLTMKKLVKAGVVDENEVHAAKALHYALTVMRGPVDQKTGLAAARTVLEWTKAKPASKSEITVNKAEEWLEAVTADNEQNAQDDSVTHEEDAGDAEASA